jgi:hypothetical protein
MHLHFGVAIFQRVGGTLGFERQLSFFSDRHKPDPERVGNGRTEEKTPRIDTDYFVDRQLPAALKKKLDRFPEEIPVDQNRGDILKDDPVFGKIGHVANARAETLDRISSHGRRLAAAAESSIRSQTPARRLNNAAGWMRFVPAFVLLRFKKKRAGRNDVRFRRWGRRGRVSGGDVDAYLGVSRIRSFSLAERPLVEGAGAHPGVNPVKLLLESPQLCVSCSLSAFALSPFCHSGTKSRKQAQASGSDRGSSIANPGSAS